ncbi:MAG TPA: hypothetical protein VGN04_03320 [Herbaspirillum sp.]|jgi:hypothetical protein
MNKISGDNALAQDLSIRTAQSKKIGTPFQQFLNNANASASMSPAGAAVAAVSVSPASVTPTAETRFVSDLNVALNAAGIGVPPSLRISAGPNGLQLDDDTRNAKFQAMLKDNPALAQNLDNMIGTATLSRKGALGDAIQSFGGSHPTGTMRDFLGGFKDSEEAKGFSVSFNGATAAVDELGANGWQPVKDKGAINNDLLAAYAQYLMKFGVSTEKQKDAKGEDTGSDADIDLKKKLAAAAEN